MTAFAMNRNYFPGKAIGNDGYIGAIIDKHAWADKTKSPRIIFTGGSSVCFGIDSKMVEQHTGMPVVNMGLNGSLGLEFILNQAKYIARPSDVVILSVEYYLSKEGSYKFKKEAERLYPPAGTFFEHSIKNRLNDFFIEDLQHNFHITFMHLMGRKTREFPKNVVYSRSSFNENGDVVRNFDPHPSHEFVNKFVLDYQVNPDIPLLNDFKEFADKKGIKVYFVYPPLDAAVYKPKEKVISKIAQEYAEEMKIKTLNTPQDALLPDSLFYDNEYHLIPAGRKARTEHVLQLMKAHNIVPIK
ncbi:hypothetical protein DYU05_04290 [Mucilaginibacter terrenus]|uniref:SGNH/GDSL hydrolase family protein n=2 Tax=Mucilaginibacter terrenus TaxID=2482727 RepID=A0A3E2NUY9_9SPHI|nr:hypothetical protein DYU05_04290 [Mucilaginibacter terrenus]